MNFIETITTAFQNVFANKLRTFLTMLGLIIGIGSVIMITSIGRGSQQSLNSQFEKIGINNLDISLKQGVDIPLNLTITDSDIDLIRQHPQITGVSTVAQYMNAAAKVQHEKDPKQAFIIGVQSDYFKIYKFDIKYGRFLQESDSKAQSNVIIISDILAKKAFGRENVVGERVTLKTQRGVYRPTVVGVYIDPNAAVMALAGVGEDYLGMSYLPYEVTKKMFAKDDFFQLVASVKDSKSMEKTATELKLMLNRKNHTKDAYDVSNKMAQNLSQINKALGVITTFISFVAGISLLVGGVGVMNIMLVTVTERTREIGIRKSLGAKNRDILTQFLMEAIILTFVGGLIGILFGYVGGIVVGKLISIIPSLSVSMIIIAFTISSAIGIIFGVYPARKASKLDPIDALRYE